MADGLKLAQLSGLAAGLAAGPATFNPAQRTFVDYLQGSAQSAISAEAQKKAEKKAKKKKGILGTLGAVGAVAAAPFTGGASLAYLPTAMAAGNAVDSAVSGDLGGAVTNAANAVGSGYGAKVAGNAPAISGPPSVSPDNNPMAMLDAIGDRAPAATSMMSQPASTNKADSWQNLSGGAANRTAVQQVASLSGRDMRKMANNDPNFKNNLLQYLQSGGTLSKKQLSALPSTTKQDLRAAGYVIPGPFGLTSY